MYPRLGGCDVGIRNAITDLRGGIGLHVCKSDEALKECADLKMGPIILAMSSQEPTATQDFHFLVLPEFSYLALMSAIEPLRVANHFRPHSYRWSLLSLDGHAVTATNGMALPVQGAFDSAKDVKTVLVLSGFNTLNYFNPALGRWLRALQGQGVTLGAIDGGAFILAQARVFEKMPKHTPVTMHWGSHSAFQERYPRIALSSALFEINDDCISCAGGISCIDLMLALIAQQHGRALATEISDWIILGRIRNQAQKQRMEVAPRHSVYNEKTIQAMELMQAHIEDIVSIDDLARLVGITRRQLERLFEKYLDATPSGFYMQLRLERARELLQQTGMGVTAVAVACGFSSASYFSRSYRAHFDISPKEDRVEAPAVRRQKPHKVSV